MTPSVSTPKDQAREDERVGKALPPHGLDLDPRNPAHDYAAQTWGADWVRNEWGSLQWFVHLMCEPREPVSFEDALAYTRDAYSEVRAGLAEDDGSVTSPADPVRAALAGKIAEARRYADRNEFELSTICLTREDTDLMLTALSVSTPTGEGERRIEATQITLGEGVVDIGPITHEGKNGVLFRPRKEHVPFGESGQLQEGEYWPVPGDVVLWVSGKGPGVAIEALAALATLSNPPGRQGEHEENLRHILTGVNKMLGGNATIETPEDHVEWIASCLQGLKSRVDHALATLVHPPQEGGREGSTYGIIDPDYARIFTQARCLAWQEGYALVMHGSFTRDLDLIAVPWAETVRDPMRLAHRIAEASGLTLANEEPGLKPHGRLAWTLVFPAFGDPRWVDLSILQAAPPPPSESEDNPELSYSGNPMPPNDVEGCVYCGVPFKDGDMVLREYEGGLGHIGCFGPERESYVGRDGEPLEDGEPIPTGYPWKPAAPTPSPAVPGSREGK